MTSFRSVIENVAPQFMRALGGRIQASPLLYRFAKGAFWSMVGAVISRGLYFISTIIVARYLGRGDFGRLDVIQSTVAIFQMVSGFGLSLMATKYVAEFREKDPIRVGRILTLSSVIAFSTGTVGALVIVVLAPWLASRTLGEPQLTDLLRIGAISIFFSAMNGAQTGALSGFEAFRTIAKVNSLAGILSFPLTVGGVYLGGLQGALWGLAASQAVNWMANHVALRSVSAKTGVPLFASGLRGEIPLVWRFAIPTVLSGLLVTPVNWIGRSLLVKQPGGFAELGIFSAGLQVTIIISYLVTILGAPIIPILTEQRRESSNEIAKHFNILFYWLLSLLIVVPLMAFPEVVGWVFGAQFSGAQSERTFVIVLFYTLIIMFKKGLSNTLIVDGRMWWGFASNTVWGVLLISAFMFLVKFGAIGFSISFAFAYMINTIVFLPIYLRTGLVPRDTLFSIDSFSIWGAVVVIGVSSLIPLPLLWRAVVFLPCVALVVFRALKIVSRISINGSKDIG